MAIQEVVVLDSKLAVLPFPFLNGDQVLNSTPSPFTLAICVMTDYGTKGGKRIGLKDDTELIYVRTGETSDAIDLLAGEALYTVNTRPSMSGTVDALSAPLV